MGVTSSVCKTDGTYLNNRSSCAELESIITNFKKNFGRRQPDTFIPTMLKWSAKTTSDLFGLEEKAANKIFSNVATRTSRDWVSKFGMGTTKVFFSMPVQILSGILEPSSLTTGTSLLKEKLDDLLYLVGEGAHSNRHQIEKNLMVIKHGAEKITIEKEWGNSPECYRSLNQFVADIERAVRITLKSSGPKIQASI
jgi:hypothetical protein